MIKCLQEDINGKLDSIRIKLEHFICLVLSNYADRNSSRKSRDVDREC